MAHYETKRSPGTRSVRISDVCYLTGLSPATVWRKIKQDQGFPRPYKLTQGVTVWDEGEVVAWIEAKKAQQRCAE